MGQENRNLAVLPKFNPESAYLDVDPTAGGDSVVVEHKFTPNILSGQSFEGRMSQAEKDTRMLYAEYHMAEVLKWLGYDVDNDPNMKDTPRRYIKVLANEIGRGTYEALPKITTFENVSGYDGIVFQGNITVRSMCAHHLEFISGRCHVAYIADKGAPVIGLSKLNRVVDYYARRPQMQEQLTQQIHDALDKLIPGNRGIAVVIEGRHTCVSMRGIEDQNSAMTTAKLSGAFEREHDCRKEFYDMIARLPREV